MEDEMLGLGEVELKIREEKDIEVMNVIEEENEEEGEGKDGKRDWEFGRRKKKMREEIIEGKVMRKGGERVVIGVVGK